MLWFWLLAVRFTRSRNPWQYAILTIGELFLARCSGFYRLIREWNAKPLLSCKRHDKFTTYCASFAQSEYIVIIWLNTLNLSSNYDKSEKHKSKFTHLRRSVTHCGLHGKKSVCLKFPGGYIIADFEKCLYPNVAANFGVSCYVNYYCPCGTSENIPMLTR